MDLERPSLTARIEEALDRSMVVALIGPRQCGKTTLARKLAASRPSHFFDLEHPVDARRLENPMTALEQLEGLIVIDEAQLHSGLAPVLRVLADRPGKRARYLVLGSASPDLIKSSSETLAGRVAFVDMGGFELRETGPENWRTLWSRGGFPKSYLARGDAESAAWRRDFIRTFLERDIRQYGVQVPGATLRRLWGMLAHNHGNVGNASEIGRSLGESHTTVKRHIDVLTGALMVRQLQPWHENIGKRQVKSPKVYIRDAGILHTLLDLDSSAAVEGHPKAGASWEGFCVETILGRTGDRNAWFWGTQGNAELDLLVFHKGRRLGFEIKFADAPGMTKSMRIAREDLKLDRLFVVRPGQGPIYALEDWAEVVPIAGLPNRLGEILLP